MARSSMTVWTERRLAKAGRTDPWGAPPPAAPSRNPRSCTVRIDCRWSWCIFQLPLTRGRRAAPDADADLAMSGSSRRGMGRVAQGVEPGEVPVLEQLERGPAARRDEADAASETEMVQCGHRIASP